MFHIHDYKYSYKLKTIFSIITFFLFFTIESFIQFSNNISKYKNNWYKSNDAYQYNRSVYSTLTPNYVLFQNYYNYVSSEERTKLKDLFIKKSYELGYMGDSEITKNFLFEKYFNYIDLNNDGHIDILYSGLAGFESFLVIIMQNNGNNMEEICTLFGRLIGFEIEENNLKTIIIENYPCCAGYMYHLETYKIDFNNKTKYKLVNKIGYTNNIQFPITRTIYKKFKTTKSIYKLRSTPYFQIYPDEYLPEIEGNVIAEFPINSTGVAIAEHQDHSGRIWWFVLIDETINPYKSIFHNGDNNEHKYKKSGWMSSKYLEIIE